MVPEGDLDRRSVLKMTAGATATLAVGAGTATAKQGGSGLLDTEVWEQHGDKRFKIVRRGGTFDFACRGNNPNKTWRCYGIRFEADDGSFFGDGDQGEGEHDDFNFYVNPNRRLDLEGIHEFTGHGLACKHVDRQKVSFKPVDQGNR